MAAEPLSQDEFRAIYEKVPRLCVEVVIASRSLGILLAQRAIPPFEGTWHMPGGTVRFGETLIAAVKRVALHELGVHVYEAHAVGCIEYPSHSDAGIDSPVSVAYLIDECSPDPIGSFQNAAGRSEAHAVAWFSELPENTHVDIVRFISRFMPSKET